MTKSIKSCSFLSSLFVFSALQVSAPAYADIPFFEWINDDFPQYVIKQDRIHAQVEHFLFVVDGEASQMLSKSKKKDLGRIQSKKMVVGIDTVRVEMTYLGEKCGTKQGLEIIRNSRTLNIFRKCQITLPAPR